MIDVDQQAMSTIQILPIPTLCDNSGMACTRCRCDDAFLGMILTVHVLNYLSFAGAMLNLEDDMYHSALRSAITGQHVGVMKTLIYFNRNVDRCVVQLAIFWLQRH